MDSLGKLRNISLNLEADGRCHSSMKLRYKDLHMAERLDAIADDIEENMASALGEHDAQFKFMFHSLTNLVDKGFKKVNEQLSQRTCIPRDPATCIEPCPEQSVARNTSGQSRFLNQLPRHCPSFVGQYAADRSRKSGDTRIHWARVMEFVPMSLNKSEIELWITSSGCWRLNGGNKCAEPDMYIVNAYCGMGGSALAYTKKLESGSKSVGNPQSRGFAKTDAQFQNCPCELRVKFVESKCILFVEVRLMDSGQSHTHGTPVPNLSIRPQMVKADPTLISLNAITDAARELPTGPGTILAHVMEELQQNLPNHEQTMLTLTSEAGKHEVARLVAKARGQHIDITTATIEALRQSQDRLYREAASPAHFPRIIGTDYRTAAHSDALKHFCVCISTDSMLDLAKLACDRKMVLVTDCTFKRVSSGHVVCAIGTTDHTSKFRLLCIGLGMREDKDTYQSMFRILRDAIGKRHPGFLFSPSFLMCDGSESINGAFEVLGENTIRLSCFSHFSKAARTQMLYKVRCRDWWPRFRQCLHILATARSTAQFRCWITFFKELLVREGFPQSVRNYVDRSPYFDPDRALSRWYWCPSRYLEAASTVRTNNAMEGVNSRIKKQVFFNSCLSLAQGLNSLLGNMVTLFSLESMHVGLAQDIMAWKKEWAKAEKASMISSNSRLVKTGYNFMHPNGNYAGDTFSVSCPTLQDEEILLNGNYNPFPVDPEYKPPSGYLVYLPPKARLSIFVQMPASQGGPACCCPDFGRCLRCPHICLLLRRYRDFNKTLNVARVTVDPITTTNVPNLQGPQALNIMRKRKRRN